MPPSRHRDLQKPFRVQPASARPQGQLGGKARRNRCASVYSVLCRSCRGPVLLGPCESASQRHSFRVRSESGGRCSGSAGRLRRRVTSRLHGPARAAAAPRMSGRDRAVTGPGSPGLRIASLACKGPIIYAATVLPGPYIGSDSRARTRCSDCAPSPAAPLTETAASQHGAAVRCRHVNPSQ